jgi:aminoglycoside phosphotransferase (APT) family kinase protein
VLATTLETPFVPGTNLKGVSVGAGWVFLLPSLELGRVVCIGDPDASAVADLTRFTSDVSIWFRTSRQRDRARVALASLGLPEASLRTETDADEVPSGSVGLVFVSGARGGRRIRSSARLRRQIARVLGDDGRIFFETDPGGLALHNGPFASGERYWRTPSFGALETAVPDGDACAIRYLLEQRLDRTRVSIEWLRRLASPGRREPPTKRRNPPEPGGLPTPRPARVESGSLRFAGRAIVAGLQAVERAAVRRPGLRRHARLLGGGADSRGLPPHYLRAVARTSELEIGSFSWGLCAGGEYASRKILFHLIDPNSGNLRYLVKLTRDPEFNVRLETAQRALRALEKLDLGPGLAVPQAVFFGHHHGRAILAETAIAGTPFERHTRRTPACPVAGRMIEALTELGARTARGAAGCDSQAQLERFADRFESLYPVSREHAGFLRAQLRLLTSAPQPFPVVFQHGDTHPGNLVVSDAGVIGLLDWEAADREGLPLWDLFHFVWSYSTLVEGARNLRTQAACFERHFLHESPLLRWLANSVDRYCARVGVSRDLAQPLFYSGWMHRAIREVVTLQPDQLGDGRYLGLLFRAIDGRESPGLRRLFRGGAREECG